MGAMLLHPRHVRSIHNSNTNDERVNNAHNSHHSSQSSSMQQTSFRPPAPRGRGGRSFSGRRFGNQPRKLYCLFCDEDKVHTTKTCQVTIQKQKEIAEAEAWQSQPKLSHPVFRGSKTRAQNNHQVCWDQVSHI
jgi:hypothetical protein